MKFCYISDADSIHTQRWVKWVANEGHEVHLISDKPAEIENVKIHLVKERGSRMNFLIRAKEVKRLVKELKPDIVQVQLALGVFIDHQRPGLGVGRGGVLRLPGGADFAHDQNVPLKAGLVGQVLGHHRAATHES